MFENDKRVGFPHEVDEERQVGNSHAATTSIPVHAYDVLCSPLCARLVAVNSIASVQCAAVSLSIEVRLVG